VTKWIQTGCLQDRRSMPAKPSSPSYFQEFLSRHW
jgi:hypothetical protein